MHFRVRVIAVQRGDEAVAVAIIGSGTTGVSCVARS
jgi:hypothetical protein